MNRKGRPGIDPAALKKILLIRLRRIGDIVLTTPAVALLKNKLPGSSLAYVVEEPYQRLVEGNPCLDQIIVIEKKQAARDFYRFLRQIRAEGYDAVIDFHGGPKAFWMTFFSRAKVRIGYQTKYKSFIYTIRIPRRRSEGPMHSVENHINLVRALGLNGHEDPPASLFLPHPRREETDRINNFLERKNLSESRTVILHVGAGNKFRDWGVTNLVELITLLTSLPQVKVVLIGSEEDKKAEEEIVKKCSPPPLSLVGELNLMELKQLISRAALFVGPDSGPMHIAASTSTPIVAYFGPTLPAHFAPWQAKAILLEKDIPCRPCRQRKCPSEDFRCLRTIRAEDVFNACRQFL
ncbi:MAG: glycosyltransferase family 9 protein [Candidatus Aminicenantales bacterium]